ncbi:hypothetical protein HNR46_003389 [Haloferula luteola]|uniref:Uncharacterized protein n=1 Tax=Haloferula luteola TaxID=595692 RepID=A0A840V7W2_9BACT|nr:hypothetical protein [Haloferula luteola]
MPPTLTWELGQAREPRRRSQHPSCSSSHPQHREIRAAAESISPLKPGFSPSFPQKVRIPASIPFTHRSSSRRRPIDDSFGPNRLRTLRIPATSKWPNRKQLATQVPPTIPIIKAIVPGPWSAKISYPIQPMGKDSTLITPSAHPIQNAPKSVLTFITHQQNNHPIDNTIETHPPAVGTLIPDFILRQNFRTQPQTGSGLQRPAGFLKQLMNATISKTKIRRDSQKYPPVRPPPTSSRNPHLAG